VSVAGPGPVCRRWRCAARGGGHVRLRVRGHEPLQARAGGDGSSAQVVGQFTWTWRLPR
jgi:hypothetical protein